MNSVYQEINNLRQKNSIAVQESILVLLTALFIAVLLPQVLIRFVYADQNLMSEPLPLQYLSPVLLVVGLLQVIATFVGNVKRSRRISELETKLNTTEVDRLQIDQQEIQELERIIEQSLAEKDKSSGTSQAQTKKKTKPRTKSKTAAK